MSCFISHSQGGGGDRLICSYFILHLLGSKGGGRYHTTRRARHDTHHHACLQEWWLKKKTCGPRAPEKTPKMSSASSFFFFFARVFPGQKKKRKTPLAPSPAAPPNHWDLKDHEGSWSDVPGFQTPPTDSRNFGGGGRERYRSAVLRSQRSVAAFNKNVHFLRCTTIFKGIASMGLRGALVPGSINQATDDGSHVPTSTPSVARSRFLPLAPSR